jgi:hypothetical protein
VDVRNYIKKVRTEHGLSPGDTDHDALLVEILGDLKNWKSYPNEDASSDRLIEKVFKEVDDLFNTVTVVQKMSASASQLHTKQLDGLVDDILHKRGIHKA